MRVSVHVCALPFPRKVDTVMMSKLILSAQVKRFLTEIFNYYPWMEAWWQQPTANYPHTIRVFCFSVTKRTLRSPPTFGGKEPSSFLGVFLWQLWERLLSSLKRCSGRWHMLKNDLKMCIFPRRKPSQNRWIDAFKIKELLTSSSSL